MKSQQHVQVLDLPSHSQRWPLARGFDELLLHHDSRIAIPFQPAKFLSESVIQVAVNITNAGNFFNRSDWY